MASKSGGGGGGRTPNVDRTLGRLPAPRASNPFIGRRSGSALSDVARSNLRQFGNITGELDIPVRTNPFRRSTR